MRQGSSPSSGKSPTSRGRFATKEADRVSAANKRNLQGSRGPSNARRDSAQERVSFVSSVGCVGRAHLGASEVGMVQQLPVRDAPPVLATFSWSKPLTIPPPWTARMSWAVLSHRSLKISYYPCAVPLQSNEGLLMKQSTSATCTICYWLICKFQNCQTASP